RTEHPDQVECPSAILLSISCSHIALTSLLLILTRWLTATRRPKPRCGLLSRPSNEPIALRRPRGLSRRHRGSKPASRRSDPRPGSLCLPNAPVWLRQGSQADGPQTARSLASSDERRTGSRFLRLEGTLLPRAWL